MTETLCYSCLNKINNSTVRLFLDQEKKKQVCKKCWDKELELRFAKTANKKPEEVMKELTEKHHRFVKAIDYDKQKKEN